jgi:hypothetical protein
VTQNDDTDLIVEDQPTIEGHNLYWARLGWNGPKSPILHHDESEFTPDHKRHEEPDYDFIIRYNPLFYADKTVVPKPVDPPIFLSRLDTSLIRKARRLLSPSYTSPTSPTTFIPSRNSSPTINSLAFTDGQIILSPYTSPSSPSINRDTDETFYMNDPDDDDMMASIYSPTDLHTTTLNTVQKRKFLGRTKSGGVVPYQSYSIRSPTDREKYRMSLHFDVTNFLTTEQMNVPTTNSNTVNAHYHSNKHSWRDSLDIMKMRKQFSQFLQLPSELHIYILSFLELGDVINMTLVSLDLCVVCEHDMLWRKACEMRGMSLHGVEKRYRKYFVENQIQVAVVGEQ